MLNSDYNKYPVYKNEKMIKNEIKMKLLSNEKNHNKVELKELKKPKVFEIQTNNYFDVLTLDENDNELKYTDDLPDNFSFHIIDKSNKIKFISNSDEKLSFTQILKENENEIKKLKMIKINVDKISELKLKLKEHSILIGKIKELENYRKLGEDYINGKKLFEVYKKQLSNEEIKLLEFINTNNYLSMSEIVKGFIDLHQRYQDHVLEENMIDLSKKLEKWINMTQKVGDCPKNQFKNDTYDEDDDDMSNDSEIDYDQEYED